MGAATTFAIFALLCLLAAWGAQAADYDPAALAAASATATAARADAEMEITAHDAMITAPEKTPEMVETAEMTALMFDIILDFLEAVPGENGLGEIREPKKRFRQHAMSNLLVYEMEKKRKEWKDGKGQDWNEKREKLATIERFATIDECVAKSTSLLFEGQSITRKLEAITMELEAITMEHAEQDQQAVREARRDSLAQTRRDLEARRDSLETQIDELGDKQYNLNLAQRMVETSAWLETFRPEYPEDYPEEHWPYCGNYQYNRHGHGHYDYNEYIRYIQTNATQEQKDTYEKVQRRRGEEYNRILVDYESRLNDFQQHRQRHWQEYWRKLGKQHRHQKVKVTSSEKNSKSDIIAAATIGASVLLLSSLAIITFRRLLQRQSKIHRRKWW